MASKPSSHQQMAMWKTPSAGARLQLRATMAWGLLDQAGPLICLHPSYITPKITGSFPGFESCEMMLSMWLALLQVRVVGMRQELLRLTSALGLDFLRNKRPGAVHYGAKIS
eukprot:9683241-Prorocentrum_lima.AAC.1